jgi:hypothetical protein
MEGNLDFESLQARINEIKKDDEHSANFTIEFIECLMNRHDLKLSIPPSFNIEDLPNSILDTIRKGEIPSIDDISHIDKDTQNELLYELVWFCGMFAISCYLYDEEEEGHEYLKEILEMSETSMGYSSAFYLVASLSLLISMIPPKSMIDRLTNNLSQDIEQIEINLNNFVQFSSAILMRYREDKRYYNV